MNRTQRRRVVITAVIIFGILITLPILMSCGSKNLTVNDDKLIGSDPNRTMTLYSAELIPWEEVNSLWKIGDNLKVYDVKTGKVWFARRFEGAKNAHVEPLDAAETAILCEIYGVSSASEIGSECRPSLVTIGAKTIACSVCAEQQGSLEEGISENDYNGYACIHFKRSITDDTNVVDSNHQKAIQYAWENCPVGHK